MVYCWGNCYGVRGGPCAGLVFRRPLQGLIIMQKAVSDFLFGLCFGMGFSIAAAVCHLIGSLLTHAQGV